MGLHARDTLTTSHRSLASLQHSLSELVTCTNFIHVTMITSTDAKTINHCICLQINWKLQKLLSLVPATSFLFKSCSWLPATATLQTVQPLTATSQEFQITSILKFLQNQELSFITAILKKRLKLCSSKL